MNKKELLEEIDSMIYDESSVMNLQSDDFNEDVLNTLRTIRELIKQLE